jgi:hypothetical protein
MVPARFVPDDAGRRRFGSRLDRFAPYLTQGDPLADAAAGALARLKRAESAEFVSRGLMGRPTDIPELDLLLRAASLPPVWFDAVRAARGGAVLRRSGVLGAVVLGFKSLMTSYASPAGNKPLTFTRQLEVDTTRRLGETARFVEAVSLPQSIVVGSPGFGATVRVRLVHAEVRRALQDSPRWRSEQWGTPICQADMAATVLLFSSVLVDGLEALGLRVTAEEREDVLHLWRGAGRLMGVEEELLCATARDASDLWEMIQSTQGPADDDGRRLAAALLEAPLREAKSPAERARARILVSLHRSLTRRFLGPELATSLGVGRTPWELALPALTRAVRVGDETLRRTPLARLAAEMLGTRYWRSVVEALLSGREAAFQAPEIR